MKHTVVYQSEICSEEKQVERSIKKMFRASGANCEFVSIWGSTLHHIDDLPYDPKEYFPHLLRVMERK